MFEFEKKKQNENLFHFILFFPLNIDRRSLPIRPGLIWVFNGNDLRSIFI